MKKSLIIAIFSLISIGACAQRELSFAPKDSIFLDFKPKLLWKKNAHLSTNFLNSRNKNYYSRLPIFCKMEEKLFKPNEC